jgi:hypothetical protein
LTTCIRFKVDTGRADTFKIEIPESLASRVDVRSIPTSRTSPAMPVDGRISLEFHPDEPVGDGEFVVVLTGTAEVAGEVWKLPAIGIPDAQQTSTILVVPGHMVPKEDLESVDPELQADSFAVPEWIKAIVPATAIGTGWKTYRWPGAAPAAEFHATSERSLKAVVDSARFDIWLEPDGSIEGWLGRSNSIGPAMRILWPSTSPANFSSCRFLMRGAGRFRCPPP